MKPPFRGPQAALQPLPETAAPPSPATDYDGCDLLIVGGGPGGVYAAWRLAVDTATLPGPSICVFERAARVGGP